MQAPKTRKDEHDRRGLWVILAAVLVLAAVAGAAAFFLLGGDDSKTESVAQAMGEAGCTYKTFKGEYSTPGISSTGSSSLCTDHSPPRPMQKGAEVAEANKS